ncbi:hypothetical protein H217_0802 [Klebsiella pneumoniae DMC0799]|nr:hypothetical protein H253_2651 [Klebsiella pneumoniae KP-7]EOY82926.1 hypothetical protein H232_3168 [Klebsiella pneumoniae UHKPC81]EOZ74654.1 hypothetical protein H254_0904 [Klebsiella pneumoniae KP-11]EPO19925.1 hypothetical protein H217_0802 [Klebsiella pneumoniae DMC0799]CDL46548.1 hypothetical protein [Klebsiella pneumoniae ISC21]
MPPFFIYPLKYLAALIDNLSAQTVNYYHSASQPIILCPAIQKYIIW